MSALPFFAFDRHGCMCALAVVLALVTVAMLVALVLVRRRGRR